MTALVHDLRTIGVLWHRDLILFVRKKSRVAGALLQPLLFWLMIGFGMSPAFDLAGTELDYQAYFFPGVVVMIILFSSIFATMSVIEDRNEGFLQGVLVGPGSRLAVVLGKSLGSTTVALIQSGLFLLLAPVAGYPLGNIRWFAVLTVLALASLVLTASGFVLAWVLNSTQAYHVVMSLILLPLWVLSGAIFPPHNLPAVLALIVRWNPLSYAVAGVRRALHGGMLPPGTAPTAGGALFEVAVLAIVAAALLVLAARVARRPVTR